MELSPVRLIFGKLAFSLVVAGVMSSCAISDLAPASTGTETSVDAVTASARTQREFDEYWAQQRELKESGAVAQVEPEPKPQPVVEAKPKPESDQPSVSKWWANRKAQEETQTKPVVQEQPIAEAPRKASPEKPTEDKKSWSISNWFGGANKDEAAVKTPEKPSPAPAVAEAPPEPEEKKSGGWWGRGKKEEPEADSDLSGIDLRGDFPTAKWVEDWDGYVRSPYNNRFVNVKGVASGTLVADPRFDLSERKFFIVP